MNGQPSSVIIGWKRSWKLSSSSPSFYRRENPTSETKREEHSWKEKELERRQWFQKRYAQGQYFDNDLDMALDAWKVDYKTWKVNYWVQITGVFECQWKEILKKKTQHVENIQSRENLVMNPI